MKRQCSYLMIRLFWIVWVAQKAIEKLWVCLTVFHSSIFASRNQYKNPQFFQVYNNEYNQLSSWAFWQPFSEKKNMPWKHTEIASEQEEPRGIHLYFKLSCIKLSCEAFSILYHLKLGQHRTSAGNHWSKGKWYLSLLIS